METNGVVLQAERLLGRPWAVVSLSLVFELPDGRHTAPTYISGSGAVTQFLQRFGAATPDELVGTVMSVDVADTGDHEPPVRQVHPRQSGVPDSVRKAFGDGQ